MSELNEGTRLSMVVGSPDADGDCTVWVTETNNPLQIKCSEITVTMENGQMAGVPWARCERADGKVSMVNLALVEQVGLL